MCLAHVIAQDSAAISEKFIFSHSSANIKGYCIYQVSRPLFWWSKNIVNTIFRAIWYVHEKALVFVLKNMLSNIVRSYCYLHCTCSMSKNWMAMMNQNYQAKQLMKRLQNNRKKIMSNSRNYQKSTHVAFSFWLMHSSVIVLADVFAQAYILGSAMSFLP